MTAVVMKRLPYTARLLSLNTTIFPRIRYERFARAENFGRQNGSKYSGGVYGTLTVARRNFITRVPNGSATRREPWCPGLPYSNSAPSRVFRCTTLLHPSSYTPHSSLCSI
ncbi:hypothetical protein FOXG_22908 [Fusarium oxysporum f. sp. lycopersici 4287]|uniref:Uncharacterized protein n=1 Tax=Fusarium oxysporum f. sp. lycopersici (strain 4287 / CBS 123668 / FGSC 9935 / NRRL 34936) TaxID=426428 RepID=A0A0J9WW60_FUSO4|nr:uncharacterized protein FOXG_22908 [Fusarium oxysporum f. sp. lycopersici 4287]EWZ77408.1 hypothetical protein FOWG_18180 [Fusarium oxysporum f. sp. lycopersici MN25]KNB20717.1 hypothetical protein FOXG_22908 [Fusarium oxysporum f. sp. lycopersici 4287]